MANNAIKARTVLEYVLSEEYVSDISRKIYADPLGSQNERLLVGGILRYTGFSDEEILDFLQIPLAQRRMYLETLNDGMARYSLGEPNPPRWVVVAHERCGELTTRHIEPEDVRLV